MVIYFRGARCKAEAGSRAEFVAILGDSTIAGAMIADRRSLRPFRMLCAMQIANTPGGLRLSGKVALPEALDSLTTLYLLGSVVFCSW